MNRRSFTVLLRVLALPLAGATVLALAGGASGTGATDRPTGRIAVSVNGGLYFIKPQRAGFGPLVAWTVVGAPAWSPDGRELAYVAGGYLSTRSVASGGQRNLASVGERFSAGPKWSPRGNRLALMLDSAAGETTRLVVLDRTGGHRHVIEQNVLPFQVPQWSPDGRRIAYLTVSGRDGVPAIAVIRPDGGGRRVVRRGIPDQPDALSWSPDGRRIAFVGPAANDPDHPTILVANANGTKARAVAGLAAASANAEVGNLRWAPAGHRIAFLRSLRRADGGLAYSELVVADAQGGGERVLVRTTYVGAVSWSPSGRWIAYVAENPEDAATVGLSVWIMRADGSGRRRIGRLREQVDDAGLSWGRSPTNG
jgi:Tol biopolymer transport system component